MINELKEALDHEGWLGVLNVAGWSTRTSALVLLRAAGTISLLAAGVWFLFDTWLTFKTAQVLKRHILLTA